MPRSPASLSVYQLGLLMAAAAVTIVAAGWLLIGLQVSKPTLLGPLERAAAIEAPFHGGAQKLARDDPSGLLFATSIGPNATPEIKVALKGIVRDPHGESALVAIADGPIGWLALNETRSGATLIAVESDKILVDTPLGFRVAPLGGSSTEIVPTASSPSKVQP